MEQNYDYIQKDAKIWCLNPDIDKKKDPQIPPYICGEVTFIDKNKKLIEVSTIDKKIRFAQTLPMVNDENINIEDMNSIQNICEIDILNNLTNRLVNYNEQFTNVNSILLLVNPYQKNDEIYSYKKIEYYINIHKTNPPKLSQFYEKPHLYKTVLIAIEKLLQKGKNQNIIITGESGSGKTEASKNSLKCILYYFQGHSEEERTACVKNFIIRNELLNPITKKILCSNLILESFGNCKTMKNDNSSRFGKYITVNLNIKENKILGGNIISFLLEKNRVISQPKNERNFHIFYQLLNCGDTELLDKLYLSQDAKNYNYISNPNIKIKNINDNQMFKETIECLEIIDFTDEDISYVLKILASILLIGNIKFNQKPKGFEIDNVYLIKNICDLMQFKEEYLIKYLTTKIININEGKYQNYTSMENCVNSRDALSKELYNRLFLWLVQKINDKLNPENKNDISENNYIGILDMYGFEYFDMNSFEQMLINYTDEQILQLYINDFYQSEINDLNREGLSTKTEHIKYKDNQNIIDLIENNIFPKLDDCSFQEKNDKFFLDTLKSDLSKNTNIILPKMKNDMIIKIKHTMKDVGYNCINLISKNKDEIKYDLVKFFEKCDDNFIKQIFFGALTAEDAEKKIQNLLLNFKKRNNKFICTKFKSDIKNLIKELKLNENNYIRCLKPNENKKEFFVTPLVLFNQIQYLGINDTIKALKAGFPTKKTYAEFFKENKILFSSIINSKNLDKKKAQIIFGKLIPNFAEINTDLNSPQYLLGTSKIFMKKNFQILVESRQKELLKKIIRSSKIIQISLYSFKKKEKLNYIQNQTANFQRFYRYNIRKIFRKKKMKNITIIQSAIKAFTSKNIISLINIKYIKIQNILRTFIAQKNFEKKKFEGKCISLRLQMLSEELDKRKKIRMKNLSNYLIKTALDNVFWDKYNQLFQKLRPYFDSFLARQKHIDKYKKAILEKYNYNKTNMMQIFQSNLLLYKIKERKICNKIIHKNFITTISSNYFFKMRESTIIIQYYLSRYLKKKKCLQKILSDNFNEENDEQQNNLIQLYLNIYPMIRFLKDNNQYEQYQYEQDIYTKDYNFVGNYTNMNKKMQRKIRRCSSMQKIEYNNYDINEYVNTKKMNKNDFKNMSQCFNIGSEYLQKNPDLNNKLVLLEHDDFKIPKVELFCRIMSMDILVDLNEIYELNWGEEFRSIYDKNMYNHTPIELISIGDTSTIMVNSIGKIYTFGWNNNCQCGINSKSSIKNFVLPEIIDKTEDINDENNNNINKTDDIKISQYPIVYYQKSKNISNKYGISANYINIFNESCFVINDKGDCFCFGNNENGQLGLGNPFPVHNIALIPILKGNTKTIKSCQDFTISLTNENDVYLWYYQSKSKINKMKTNNDFTKQSSKKSIYSNNRYFMEESKDFTDYIESGINYGVPFKINFLNKKIKISQISCGCNFAMLLSSDGILFGIGNNKNGELGVIYNEEELKDKKLKLTYFHSPVQNIIMSDIYKEKIMSVKCGFKHTICLTGGRRLYGWGRNRNGQLGIGNYEDQLIPVQIFLNITPIEKVIQIQAGFRSSIFLTENRNIYYTGILDKDNSSKFPTKFNVKIKSPEICPENKLHIVRILTSWSKNASIFYVTVADIRKFNTQNINKLNKVIDVLAKNWKDENVKCPRISTISNYFSSTYMK